MEISEATGGPPIPGSRSTFTFALIAALQYFGSRSGNPMQLLLRWGRLPTLHFLHPRNRSTTSAVTSGCRHQGSIKSQLIADLPIGARGGALFEHMDDLLSSPPRRAARAHAGDRDDTAALGLHAPAGGPGCLLD